MRQHPARRVGDKNPPRELYLQELVNLQDEELLKLRSENTRMRAELARQHTRALKLRNFCGDCGKRNVAGSIHTCTPPQTP